ncbi:hypothetical protein CDD83_2753 [Cordyceps sp. RAO-2017]|nr:hypothetical protein CDD83_2753 [Cordyceps sp. RAO-2017]
MPAVSRLVALGLACCSAVVSGSPLPESAIPGYFRREPFTRRDLSPVQAQRELGKALSNGTSIFGPSDPRFKGATARWNSYDAPDIQLVIEVARESDVSLVVKYCNDNSIDFLAYSRGHGSTSTLAKMKGIEINLSKLNAITIRPGGKSALFQGGTYGKLVIETLWDKGYVTTTGSNGCVGLLGPGLGGGYGRYQGLYGLISDNFITLNVVLADGRAVKVSKSSHEDLFWAMQGAGHNYGIVTSAELKIHPRKIDTWHYHNYAWSQDQLETVFEALNRFQGKGKIPTLMGVNFGQFTLVPSISKTDPVLNWTFAYAGPADEAEKLLRPFNAIKALSHESGDVPYPQILAVQGTSDNGFMCSPQPYVGSSALLQTYNVTAQRQIYDLFRKQAKEQPELAANARVFYEGYASEATQAVRPDSSAFPHRDEYLVVFFTAVAPGNLRPIARKWGNDVRDLWNAGQPDRRPATYVNYANGEESLESMYGYEPWRLERLRGLKAKYDPHNRFRFYNPIVA